MILVLLNATLNGCFSFVFMFMICELGQRMNDAFDKIDSTIEKLDWYLFPNEIQRMVPTIMAIAQQPVTLRCFGSIVCTRDVFKDVGID